MLSSSSACSHQEVHSTEDASIASICRKVQFVLVVVIGAVDMGIRIIKHLISMIKMNSGNALSIHLTGLYSGEKSAGSANWKIDEGSDGENCGESHRGA
jgi:hypothetical protein